MAVKAGVSNKPIILWLAAKGINTCGAGGRSPFAEGGLWCIIYLLSFDFLCFHFTNLFLLPIVICSVISLCRAASDSILPWPHNARLSRNLMMICSTANVSLVYFPFLAYCPIETNCQFAALPGGRVTAPEQPDKTISPCDKLLY